MKIAISSSSWNNVSFKFSHKQKQHNHYKTFKCLSSGWATTTSRLLGSKVGNSIKCLSQGHSFCVGVV